MSKAHNIPGSQRRQLGLKKFLWTTEMMIYAIDLWHRQHLRAPTVDDWIRAGENHPNRTTIQRRFGSWNRSLSAAGLEPEDAGTRGTGGVGDTAPRQGAFCRGPEATKPHRRRWGSPSTPVLAPDNRRELKESILRAVIPKAGAESP